MRFFKILLLSFITLGFNLHAKDLSLDNFVKMNSNTKYTVYIECSGKTFTPSIVNNGVTIDLVFHNNNFTYLTGFSRGTRPIYQDKFNPELRYFTKNEIKNAAKRICLTNLT